jgi:DNA-binding response OmpR family regulator
MNSTTGQKNASILLVEDDKSLAEWIKDYLQSHHFHLLHLDQGEKVVALAKQNPPDLIILDVMLPGKNGFDICRELRQFYRQPILMLTACDEETDEVLGLELGANDYLGKPVRPRILLARIHALLRRDLPDTHQDGQLTFGQLHIVRDAKAVFYRDQAITLTSHEFDVLWILASHAGQVVSRDQLVSELRGFEYNGLDRSIDLRVSRLRKKLDDNAETPHRIKTIWARGYLFSPEAWD